MLPKKCKCMQVHPNDTCKKVNSHQYQSHESSSRLAGWRLVSVAFITRSARQSVCTLGAKARFMKKRPTSVSKSPPKAGAKAKPVKLLAGGNPQIAKADGDAPVQAYIAAMPGWKRDIGKRIDALIVRHVPDLRKAVKWNSPFYGIEGRGWFLGFHTFTHYVKVTFFLGTSLRPVPPGGTGKDARWIDIHEDDLDEAQMAKWVKQASALPGWVP